MTMYRLKSYNNTLAASYIGYVVQAIVNCFVPLLFIRFTQEFSIDFTKITLIVTLNFIIQLSVDAIASKLVDKIGYRISMIIAHVLCAAGLSGLAWLPNLIGGNYAGILICVVMYAIGGGLIEVCISPIVESCPTKKKSAAMSLLHSFYCWGSVAVIALSSVFFIAVGIEKWRLLAIIWAIIPAFNAVYFIFVPLVKSDEDGERCKIISLMKNKIFWLTAILILCAGASELAMSQWASAFAEKGLGVSKTVGDILGPCLFAVCMGISRVGYAKLSDKINLTTFMMIGAVLCVISYLLVVFSPIPALSLVGCSLCGFSVGIFWPGTFSLAAGSIKGGGTTMFALLALFGDMGCMMGPTAVGALSSALGDDLKVGLSLSIVFPTVIIIVVIILNLSVKKSKKLMPKELDDGAVKK